MLETILTLLLILILLFLLWLLLICPSDSTNAYYEKFANRSYAHRGLHDAEKPENTIPAFRAAVEAGYGIELDIQLSGDGKVVVFHDDTFERVCGDKRRIEDTDYESMKKLRILESDQYPPLFTEVLDVVGGKVPLIVEFKHRRDIGPLCEEAIKILDEYKGDFCTESFDPRIMGYLRKKRPSWMRGQLACKNEGVKPKILDFVLENVMLDLVSRPHFIAYRHEDMKNLSYRLSTGLLKGLSAAWTVKSMEDFEALCKKDVDMMIFEGFKAPLRPYEEN